MARNTGGAVGDVVKGADMLIKIIVIAALILVIWAIWEFRHVPTLDDEGNEVNDNDE